MLYTLRGIECRVGQFTLVVDDLELKQGEICAVVGPNGSGKSTLMNALAFLVTPSRGTVSFRGKEMDYGSDLIDYRREVGYTMQNPYLFDMSVEDNIAYGLSVRSVPGPETRTRVSAIMERMGLSHLAGRPSRELSVGESQRVALARTLVLDTRVILLDEPTASVDAANIETVEKTVLELCKERDISLVLSTHSLEQAERMSSMTVTVTDGKVQRARA